MREFYTQINGATYIVELSKKHIVLDGVAERDVGCLVQISKDY